MARDTPLGFPAHTLPYRCGEFTTLSAVSSVRGFPRTLFRSLHRLAGKGSPSMRFALYDRRAAVLYAHRWAYGRNPAFYDYEHLGGDCTNFASQCIYAGSGVMNFTPTFGWYYIDPDQKAPAWTGVPYLYNFLVREEKTEGPAARPCELSELRPGDLIQLSFDGENFRHTPVVVSVGWPVTPENVLVAAHSYDADNRPLSTYSYQDIRFLKIFGVWHP